MDHTEILKRALAKALNKEEKTMISPFPKRERSEATKSLDSNEVLHLAKHIIKYTLWPQSSYVKGWLTEIKASLDNLAFGLSRNTRRVGNDRVIETLWYSADILMDAVNAIHDTAYWAVIKEVNHPPLKRQAWRKETDIMLS